ncbi:hypothetical protein SAMN06296273_0738 [Nitrosomonas ureae]|uniref:Uncharacterized protein n=1 Tax=Nitrosomonas ureae TaxID=44577 RepID=A0A285BVQ2_9PROT|nr:hypothetical protein SAMN06296273_0738 [Nitrosomonas ureae]
MNRDISKRKKHFKDCLQQLVRLLTNLVFLIGFISLTGCAGIHFYNPDNDATASLVKKTSDEINFKAILEEERKNQAKLLDHELEIVAQAALIGRNTILRALLEDRKIPGAPEAESLSKKQERMINDRLLELTGHENTILLTCHKDTVPVPFTVCINEFYDTLENLSKAVERFSKLLSTSAPECRIGVDAKFVVDNKMIDKYEAAAKSIKSNADVRRLLQSFKERCEKHQEAWKELAKIGGIFSVIAQEESKANEEMEKQEKAKGDAKEAYDKALEKYKEALKQAETDVSDVTKKINDKADQLKEALGTLSKTGILGKQSATKLQIDNINLLLDVLAKDKLDEGKLNCSEVKPEEKEKCLKTKEALTVVAQLPSFAGRFVGIEALTALPPINALLFEKERLMTLKEDAEKQIDRTKSIIALLQQKRAAALDEIESLMMSQQHINWARQANGNNEIKLSDLYQRSINEPARRHMVIAMTRFLNASTGSQRLIHEIKYRLLDIEHGQALDASETALRLWEVAIKQPVNALAAYHGSGMKREELAKLMIEALKAAGLFTIAGGVLN